MSVTKILSDVTEIKHTSELLFTPYPKFTYLLFMASRICCKRPLSLIFSLIYQNFIPVNTLPCKRQKAIILDNIHFPFQQFSQSNRYFGDCHKRYFRIIIIPHKDINITLRSIFTARERAKQPCLLYRLRCKKVLYIVQIQWFCCHNKLFIV